LRRGKTALVGAAIGGGGGAVIGIMPRALAIQPGGRTLTPDITADLLGRIALEYHAVAVIGAQHVHVAGCCAINWIR